MSENIEPVANILVKNGYWIDTVANPKAGPLQDGTHSLYLHTPHINDAAIGKMQGEIERLRNERGDLSVLVVRLIRRMRIARSGRGFAAGDSALEQQATEYLRRKGLLPSPLRGDE